jgi:hypothetical protein
MQGPTTSKVHEKQTMDTRTNVVNDLPTTLSQTIPINCEYNPLEFYSPTNQVV